MFEHGIADVCMHEQCDALMLPQFVQLAREEWNNELRTLFNKIDASCLVVSCDVASYLQCYTTSESRVGVQTMWTGKSSRITCSGLPINCNESQAKYCNVVSFCEATGLYYAQVCVKELLVFSDLAQWSTPACTAEI